MVVVGGVVVGVAGGVVVPYWDYRCRLVDESLMGAPAGPLCFVLLLLLSRACAVQTTCVYHVMQLRIGE